MTDPGDLRPSGSATTPSRVRILLYRTTLLGLGLVCGLVLTELGLRLIGADHGGVFTVSERQFERLPGIFEPSQEVRVRQIPELPYTVRIDSLGYRGPPVARVKPDGELRILFVGDSFVFGSFVEEDETLPATLQSMLSGRCTAPVRVINAGLGGSTITEHAPMIERGRALDPDLVVLLFSENDVGDLAGGAMWDALARNREAKSRLPFSVVYPVMRGTALWQLALESVAVLRNRRDREAVERAAAERRDDGAAGGSDRFRDEYRRRLTELLGSLRREGIPLVYAVYPSHLSVYDLWDSDQLVWLDRVIAELALDPVSFLPPLVADGRSERELYLLPYDGHPSPEGYRVTANALAGHLLGSGALTSWCG